MGLWPCCCGCNVTFDIDCNGFGIPNTYWSFYGSGQFQPPTVTGFSVPAIINIPIPTSGNYFVDFQPSGYPEVGKNYFLKCGDTNIIPFCCESQICLSGCFAEDTWEDWTVAITKDTGTFDIAFPGGGCATFPIQDSGIYGVQVYNPNSQLVYQNTLPLYCSGLTVIPTGLTCVSVLGCGALVESATVSVDGLGSFTTDENGTACFYMPDGSTRNFSISAEGYNTHNDSLGPCGGGLYSLDVIDSFICWCNDCAFPRGNLTLNDSYYGNINLVGDGGGNYFGSISVELNCGCCPTCTTMPNTYTLDYSWPGDGICDQVKISVHAGYFGGGCWALPNEALRTDILVGLTSFNCSPINLIFTSNCNCVCVDDECTVGEDCTSAILWYGGAPAILTLTE